MGAFDVSTQPRRETISTRVTREVKADLEFLALARNTTAADLLRGCAQDLSQQAQKLREKLTASA